jgi:uncharacterized integral membrane protein (TIGR00697 family)
MTAPSADPPGLAADPRAERPRAHAPARSYRYYDLIMAAFVTVLLCTNLVSAPKRVTVGGFTFGAGVLFFPISYLFGDILTEVYGYARSRKVVWSGFAALGFASFMSVVVLAMPPAANWTFRETLSDGSTVELSRQVAWQQVFGGTWRIVFASMLGFFAGEFVNSFTLAKMKILTRGRFLWTRTIGSTVAGEAADSLIFYPVAFAGIWTTEQLAEVMVMNYLLKVGWEVLATPATYGIVNFLKRAEHEDYYDYGTDFTPFSLET